jgi:catechol 2,3-dioxygenase-like lactoylglutathione lyase family enzyme
MIKQIKFVSIPVADQKRALDFYTEKLGFTIITDQPFDEKQRWIELRVPKAETRVVLFTMEGEEKRIGLDDAGDVFLRRHRQDLRRIEGAGRRVRRSSTETTVGEIRDVQGQRREPLRDFGGLERPEGRASARPIFLHRRG